MDYRYDDFNWSDAPVGPMAVRLEIDKKRKAESTAAGLYPAEMSKRQRKDAIYQYKLERQEQRMKERKWKLMNRPETRAVFNAMLKKGDLDVDLKKLEKRHLQELRKVLRERGIKPSDSQRLKQIAAEIFSKHQLDMVMKIGKIPAGEVENQEAEHQLPEFGHSTYEPSPLGSGRKFDMAMKKGAIRAAEVENQEAEHQLPESGHNTPEPSPLRSDRSASWVPKQEAAVFRTPTYLWDDSDPAASFRALLNNEQAESKPEVPVKEFSAGVPHTNRNRVRPSDLSRLKGAKMLAFDHMLSLPAIRGLFNNRQAESKPEAPVKEFGAGVPHRNNRIRVRPSPLSHGKGAKMLAFDHMVSLPAVGEAEGAEKQSWFLEGFPDEPETQPVRSLVNYELPKGEERAEWDTDELRRAFGEIE